MDNDLSSAVKCRIFFKANFVGAGNLFIQTGCMNGWMIVQAGRQVDAFHRCL
jgi:hypothetical protein